MHNSGTAYLSIRHGIGGPVHTHGSACAASGAAIGEAARAIRDGHIDIALAGGAEAPLSAAILAGFEGMRALAPMDAVDVAQSCKPFSRAAVWCSGRAPPFSCWNRQRMPGGAKRAAWHGCKIMA